jgi:hypothetical protein
LFIAQGLKVHIQEPVHEAENASETPTIEVQIEHAVITTIKTFNSTSGFQEFEQQWWVGQLISWLLRKYKGRTRRSLHTYLFSSLLHCWMSAQDHQRHSHPVWLQIPNAPEVMEGWQQRWHSG